jgi:hypothetical protein
LIAVSPLSKSGANHIDIARFKPFDKSKFEKLKTEASKNGLSLAKCGEMWYNTDGEFETILT